MCVFTAESTLSDILTATVFLLYMLPPSDLKALQVILILAAIQTINVYEVCSAICTLRVQSHIAVEVQLIHA